MPLPLLDAPFAALGCRLPARCLPTWLSRHHPAAGCGGLRVHIAMPVRACRLRRGLSGMLLLPTWRPLSQLPRRRARCGHCHAAMLLFLCRAGMPAWTGWGVFTGCGWPRHTCYPLWLLNVCALLQAGAESGGSEEAAAGKAPSGVHQVQDDPEFVSQMRQAGPAGPAGPACIQAGAAAHAVGHGSQPPATQPSVVHACPCPCWEL